MSTKAKIKKAAKAAGNIETKEIINIALITGVGIGLFSLAKTFGLLKGKKREKKKKREKRQLEHLKKWKN